MGGNTTTPTNIKMVREYYRLYVNKFNDLHEINKFFLKAKLIQTGTDEIGNLNSP